MLRKIRNTKVHGFELNASAVADAKRNAADNGIPVGAPLCKKLLDSVRAGCTVILESSAERETREAKQEAKKEVEKEVEKVWELGMEVQQPS